MSALRFLAALFILVATVALVADLTPWLGGYGRFEFLSLAEYWQLLSPGSFAATEAGFTSGLFAAIWTFALQPMIGLPAFLIFAGLALLCGYLGRERYRINIYQI